MTKVNPSSIIGSGLGGYCHYVFKAMEGNGFKSPKDMRNIDSVLARLMLIVTEVAEAAEDVRIKNQDGFNEEIADTFIRLMHLCGSMNIDIENEIARKMMKNNQRPYRHGKDA